MGKYLIIGGSSGIGRSLTKLLTNEGHDVIATYKDSDPLDNPSVENHYFDVLNGSDELSFIPDGLDGLVYCPGSINLKPFERIKIEDFKSDFDLQVIGAIKIIQAALPALKKGVKPSIVLFSTVAVQSGYNFHTQVSVSKGAIEGLARSLAAELAPTIRVNCIAPSLTDTPLAARLLSSDEKKEGYAKRNPLNKVGESIDIANSAAFLLSSKANWITGQVIHVDGGASSLHV